MVEESRPLVDPAGERLCECTPVRSVRNVTTSSARHRHASAASLDDRWNFNDGTTTTGTSNERPSKTPPLKTSTTLPVKSGRPLTSYLEQARMRQIKRGTLATGFRSSTSISLNSTSAPGPSTPDGVRSRSQVASRWSIQRTATPGIKQYRTDPPHTPSSHDASRGKYSLVIRYRGTRD